MMKYYSTIKMNESLPFERTWTDLEGIMLSEMSRQIPHDFTCVWNVTKLIEQNRNKFIDTENK